MLPHGMALDAQKRLHVSTRVGGTGGVNLEKAAATTGDVQATAASAGGHHRRVTQAHI